MTDRLTKWEGRDEDGPRAVIDVCPVCGKPSTIGKPVTNADRIRAMSDEELAAFIRDLIIDRNIGIPSETWLGWLRQEGKE